MTPSAAKPSLADRLRAVMRAMPQPVTVVAATHGGESVGAVIGSFTSVSLAPPLFSFNLQHGSALRTAVEAGAPFAVHVLGVDQADLAARFITPGLTHADRFGADLVLDEEGVPVIPALARIRGRVHARISAGDHLLVIADVVSIDGPDGDTDALTYSRRSFGHFEPIGL